MMKKKHSVEVVQAYKTSDGKIFEKESDAQEVECRLARRARIEKFVAEHAWSGMCRTDIEHMLVENADVLRRILS
jgi:hypothetical protein